MQTCSDSSRKEIEIYRRILKYPPFLTRRTAGPMRLIHILDSGAEVISESVEAVTVEDAEKLFAAIYFIQNSNSLQARHNGTEVETVAGRVHVRDITNLTNCHDDEYVRNSLERITKLSITYNFDGKKVVTHIIHKVVVDKEGNITLLFDKQFFDLCKQKYLTLDVALYCRFSPTTKNLYSYLCGNPAEKFLEGKLWERAGITAGQTRNKRIALKKALDELVKHKYIFSYRIEAGFVYLKRPRARAIHP